MAELIWLVLAWLGGIALILGSLMTIGSLLLWLVPASATTDRKSKSDALKPWQNRWTLTGVSLALTLLGLALLAIFPFPAARL